MIGRRGLLGLLLGAPVAVPALLGQQAVGSVAEAATSVGPKSDIDPEWDIARKLANEMRRPLESQDFGLHIPAHIAGKKSWSDSFKVSVAYKEYMRRTALRDAIDDALHGDPLKRMAALHKLAKKMGHETRRGAE